MADVSYIKQNLKHWLADPYIFMFFMRFSYTQKFLMWEREFFLYVYLYLSAQLLLLSISKRNYT